jgi:hypothetical protein
MRLMVAVVLFGAATVLSSRATAASKPSTTNYLGKWEGTIELFDASEGVCHLDISKVGENFVVDSERQTIGNCEAFVGIFTLTPGGSLRGGSTGSVVIAYDRERGRAIVSGLGKLRYLTRGLSEEQQNQRRLQQKRAMSDIRAIARGADLAASSAKSFRSMRSVAAVAKATKMDLPVTDPWGSPYLFEPTSDGYTITCYGADRKKDEAIVPGGTRSFNADIIFVSKGPKGDGFVTYPEGPQQ